MGGSTDAGTLSTPPMTRGSLPASSVPSVDIDHLGVDKKSPETLRHRHSIASTAPPVSSHAVSVTRRESMV